MFIAITYLICVAIKGGFIAMMISFRVVASLSDDQWYSIIVTTIYCLLPCYLAPLLGSELLPLIIKQVSFPQHTLLT